MARAAGFARINVDLIYGTPGESLDDWRRTVEGAIALGVEHVSAYALTVEPATPLGKAVAAGTRAAPDDDLQADAYVLADDMLGAAGFTWYEISNWARPEEACRHNLAYWHGDEYVAIGCAAHGYTGGRRWWNVRTPERYVDAIARGVSPEAGAESLDPAPRGGGIIRAGAADERRRADRRRRIVVRRRARGRRPVRPTGRTRRAHAPRAAPRLRRHRSPAARGRGATGRVGRTCGWHSVAWSATAGAARRDDAQTRGHAMTDLDDRKAAILRAIVEHYVDTAQPVGSQTVTQTAGLGVSAATVRNEMSVLEREGYITQPHTSAGRVPTDQGYRYYVDQLAGAAQLAAPERRRISEFFTSATMAMDELLAQTSHLLARVTAHAAVVVAPESQAVVVRAAHVVQLQPRVLLVVVVLSNGSVVKEVVHVDLDAPEAVVATASARLAKHLDGRRLSELTDALPDVRGRGDVDALVRTACEALRAHVEHHQSDALYIGGVSRLAAEHDDFVTTNTARLLELLEQHVVLATLLRELLGPGLTVRIGSENTRADLLECSIVLAPYLVEGELAGTVGVLGPTRMDYRKAQAAVVTVSQQLGRQLSR